MDKENREIKEIMLKKLRIINHDLANLLMGYEALEEVSRIVNNAYNDLLSEQEKLQRELSQ